jgi:hypothetical protein
MLKSEKYIAHLCSKLKLLKRDVVICDHMQNFRALLIFMSHETVEKWEQEELRTCFIFINSK